MITQTQINSNDLPLRRKHIRIEILDYDFKTIDTIEEECIGGSLQKVADDSSYTIRRSGNVQLAIPTFAETEEFFGKLDGYEIELGGKLWIDRYVKIFIGIEDYLQVGSPIVWNPFGICLIDNPIRKFSASEFEVSFNVIDLLAKLTGERQGQLTGMTTMVEAGYYDYSTSPSIYVQTETGESLTSIIRDLGGFNNISMFEIPQRVKYLPYDIKIDIGSTVWDLISQYMKILSTWQIYFDDNGVVIVEPIPNGKNDIVFPLNEEYIVSTDLSVNYNNVKNQVVVYGRLNTLNYLAEFTSYSGNTLNLYYNILDEGIFTIGGTNFGFVAPNEYNANDLNEVKIYVNNVLTYTNTLVGFENIEDSIKAESLQPNEVYFLRIYDSELVNFGELISNPFGTSAMYSMCDDTNKIYCGVGGGMFAIYNKSSGTFGTLISNPFGSTNIRSISCDFRYVYCGGESAKFAIYDKDTKSFGSLISTHFGSNGIYSVTGDATKIYCGGQNGSFEIYDKASGVFGGLISTSFGSSTILGMANDDKYVYCVGGDGKIEMFNKNTGTFGGLISSPFGSNDLRCVAVDGISVYIGGANGSFAVYNKETEVFTIISTPFTPVGDIIFSMAIDNKNIYCGAGGGHFAVFDKKANTFSDFVTNPFGTSAFLSLISDGINVYCGAGFDGSGGKFIIYNKIGNVVMSTAILEFVGKQQVSWTLVDENLQSPFYINAGLKQPNYYCGLSYGLGQDYELTLNNTSELSTFDNNTIITFMANQNNLANATITIIDGVSGDTLVSSKLIKKNFWNGATRDNLSAGVLSTDYTIYELQYDSVNEWFVFKGRYKLAYTKVFSGGEYDNIFADTLAYERCLYELYLHTNLNNTINISMVPNYVLGVNMKIPYNTNWSIPNGFDMVSDNGELKNYFVKSINYPLGISNSPQSITAIEIYDSGNLLGEN